MVRAHLLKSNPDPAFQIAVIEEAMYNFHRYFFQMPTLARLELDMHERVERGEASDRRHDDRAMADLFSEGYGGEMAVDRERVGITWAAVRSPVRQFLRVPVCDGHIGGACAGGGGPRMANRARWRII